MPMITGFNYLFHGMNEHYCRERIKRFIGTASGVTFFPWSLQELDISKLHVYCDDAQSKLSIDYFTGANNKSPWIDCIKNKKDKKKTLTLKGLLDSDAARYIILDAVHLLAHADSNPAKYYKELLSACNFHAFNNNINFIIACARIPIVFHKENPLRHLWDFVECSMPEVKWEEHNNKEILNDIVCNSVKSTNQHLFEKIEARIELKDFKTYDASTTPGDMHRIDDGLINAIDGASESLSLFNSDIYLPEKRSALLDEGTKKRIVNIADVIVGQDEAVQRLIEKVLISRNPADPEAAAKDPKPLGIFLFVGPSGVGKTRISQKLADELPDYKFLQINLGEHQDRESVNKLIGIGRGYVDSEQGGILTEPVRLHSKYILLFDELDQAHNSVGQLFYKIFEGEVTDGRGRRVSFSECYIIMTTNEGVLAESSRQSLVDRQEKIEEQLKDVSNPYSKLKFTDAFLGRIYDTIHFKPLSLSDLTEIAIRYFDVKIRKPYLKIGISDFTFETKDLGTPTQFSDPQHIISKGIINRESLFFELFAILAGNENKQGARRLFRLMDEYVITPLELARIECPVDSNVFAIKFVFKPVLPKFNKPTIVIIDDEPATVKHVTDMFCELMDVEVLGFDMNNEATIKKAQAVLLDLLDGGSPISIDEMVKKIKTNNSNVPIILHSSLKDGPYKGRLKNETWKAGTFGYISKEDKPEQIKQVVFKAIREYHSRLKVGTKLINFTVTPPVSYDDSNLIFAYNYDPEEQE